MQTTPPNSLPLLHYTCTPRIYPEDDGRNRVYVVTKGSQPGIYKAWVNGAEAATQGVPGAAHSQVKNEKDALRAWRQFCINNHTHTRPASPRAPPATPSRPRAPASTPATPLSRQREERNLAIEEALSQMSLQSPTPSRHTSANLHSTVPPEYQFFAVRGPGAPRVVFNTRAKAVEALLDLHAEGQELEMIYARSLDEAEEFMFDVY
ncbi:hypothetical protein PLICRDRAFT_178060 [Plicaturopsis crispa FD-325 SS-3]|nr:hypothetical protein PLICRDRAFT_178060 [Plicaturopsis crispa FD-325 SS-3]